MPKKLTTKEFIKKSKKVHGNKYDYSKVIYVKAINEVEIICKEHRSFFQKPIDHLNSNGCPKCSGRGLSNEERIKLLIKVHGNKYDYSKVKYTKAINDIVIICPEHGEFRQSYIAHRGGARCPRCAGGISYSAKEAKKKLITIHHGYYKYPYIENEYKNSSSEITIICPKHGMFKQKYANHCNGGCRKCAGNYKPSQEEAIEKLRIKHIKYDYSKAVYTTARANITIICPEHGEFEQVYDYHLRGGMCPICSNRKKLTNDEFLIKARNIHGDKYDYSHTDYVNVNEKVKIGCRVSSHGIFLQSPFDHYKGKECCPLCNGKGLNKEEFIRRSNEVHDHKYDYSKVKYEKSTKTVEIVCKTHGLFLQSPSQHMRGRGCPICSGTYHSNTEEFIKKAQRIHGDKYDYSKVEYVDWKTKVVIICKDHGEFTQTPNAHLCGRGCDRCGGTSSVSVNDAKQRLGDIYGDRYTYPHMDKEYVSIDSPISICCPKHGIFIKTFYHHCHRRQGCPLCNDIWTVDKIRFLLSEIRPQLSFLSQVERRYILLAKGILDITPNAKGHSVITNHLATDPNLDLIEIDKFINNEPNIYDDAMETGDLSLVKDEDNGIYDATKSKEKEPSLPVISNINSIFAGTDCLTDIISDQTIIEALINESVGKAIQQICQNEKCVKKIKKEKKKLYSKEAQNRILDLYQQAKKVKIPKDYNFRINGELVKPNLMQRFTVVLLRKNKNLLNYSGTGAGKTLSAILAARDINAKKTIIVCPNDVIHGWKETISGVDPTANIFVNTFDTQLDLSHSNYLIFNIEKFQQPDAMDHIKCLLASQIDFIIVDEVQMAKYRNAQKATTRNINIRALASNTRKVNPNVHVMVMSATPVVNEISEGYSILEILTGEEFDNKNNRITIENCVKLRSHIVSQGIRWVMGHRQELNLQTIDVDATDKKEEVIKLNSRNPMDLECIFIDKKLEAIKDYIKPGTILYSLYKGSGLLNKCRKFVKGLGFSVSEYTGDQNFNLRKQIKDDFVSGKIDVLIATSPIATGIDKLQYRCNNMIIVSMSWTSSQTEQLIGRILRQGQTQDEVNVIIPICYIDVKDKRWSWDQYRYNIIENKRTMSDIVVSGTIPDKHKLSDQKVLAAMLDWIKRVDDGKIIDVKRRESFVPLSEKSMEKRIRKYGDFTELNRRWNAENSNTTHKRLQQDSSEYETYHNEQQRAMKDWDVKPIDDIIVPFLKDHPDKVVGDFGSGPLAELSTKVDNRVYSFDHLGNKSTGVVRCNLSSMPKEYYNAFDIVVFSLSLMGRDFSNYLKEANKCLKKDGILYIVECSSRIKDLNPVLNDIGDLGFKDVKYESLSRFIRISATKDKHRVAKDVKLNFGRKY